MKKLEKICKAFGNGSRLKIVQYLKKHSSASVVEIAEGTRCSYRATSKHLGILFHVDIVDRKQVRYEVHYRLSSTMEPAASALLKFL